MRDIKIGAKTYKLHYGQNSICALEDELNEGISEIYACFAENKVIYKYIRALIWAGLLKEQRSLTPEDVGNLCDEAGINLVSLLPECIEELNSSFHSIIQHEDTHSETDTKKK